MVSGEPFRVSWNKRGGPRWNLILAFGTGPRHTCSQIHNKGFLSGFRGSRTSLNLTPNFIFPSPLPPFIHSVGIAGYFFVPGTILGTGVEGVDETDKAVSCSHGCGEREGARIK